MAHPSFWSVSLRVVVIKPSVGTHAPQSVNPHATQAYFQLVGFGRLGFGIPNLVYALHRRTVVGFGVGGLNVHARLTGSRHR